MPLNLNFSLYTLSANSKVVIDLFGTKLTILLKTLGTHSSSSSQPLECEAKTDKTIQRIFLNIL